MNPAGSALYPLLGPIPFGVANEALDTWSPGFPRHEDHVGQKIAWANAVPVVDTFGHATAITCDVLVKLHQGTHSKDAFTNNLHELIYAAKCSDGVFAYATFLTAIGDPGEFIKSCVHDVDVVEMVGPATPSNSPDGNGKRRIPDADCLQHGQVDEEWNTESAIRTAPASRQPDGALLAHFNPYFNVSLPARAYDPTVAGLLVRPMDACNAGTIGTPSAAGAACREATANHTIPGIAWDDPRSPFNGVTRRVAINRLVVPGAASMVWYTDPFGRNGRATPFPGSVRQVFRGTTTDWSPGPTRWGRSSSPWRRRACTRPIDGADAAPDRTRLPRSRGQSIRVAAAGWRESPEREHPRAVRSGPALTLFGASGRPAMAPRSGARHPIHFHVCPCPRQDSNL